MATREEICNKALEYLDVPFHHQGRNKFGVDCAGLIVCVAQELRLFHEQVSDIKGYSRIPDGKQLREVLINGTAKEKTINELQPGDILLMRFVNEPQHVALYMPKNQIIHSYQRAGKVTIHDLDKAWRSRIISCFEYFNVEEAAAIE